MDESCSGSASRVVGSCVFNGVVFALWFLLLLPLAAQSQYAYVTNNGTITLTQYLGPGGVVTIPDWIDGLPVTAIGTHPDPWGLAQGAFYHTSVGSVTMGTNLVGIGDWAFCDCESLTNLIIPSSVTSIGRNVFWNCPISNLIIPDSVTNIGAYTIYECPRLTNVVIGNGVISLGESALAACMVLSNVYFMGNAPTNAVDIFTSIYTFPPETSPAVVQYLPGTTGWGPTFCGNPTLCWNPRITSTPYVAHWPGDGTTWCYFNVAGNSNLTFSVECCTNLSQGEWFAVNTFQLVPSSQHARPNGELFPLPSGEYQYGDFICFNYYWDNYPQRYTARFYRLNVPGMSPYVAKDPYQGLRAIPPI
jgi:hypothetical protein